MYYIRKLLYPDYNEVPDFSKVNDPANLRWRHFNMGLNYMKEHDPFMIRDIFVRWSKNPKIGKYLADDIYVMIRKQDPSHINTAAFLLISMLASVLRLYQKKPPAFDFQLAYDLADDLCPPNLAWQEFYHWTTRDPKVREFLERYLNPCDQETLEKLLAAMQEEKDNPDFNEHRRALLKVYGYAATESSFILHPFYRFVEESRRRLEILKEISLLCGLDRTKLELYYTFWQLANNVDAGSSAERAIDDEEIDNYKDVWKYAWAMVAALSGQRYALKYCLEKKWDRLFTPKMSRFRSATFIQEFFVFSSTSTDEELEGFVDVLEVMLQHGVELDGWNMYNARLAHTIMEHPVMPLIIDTFMKHGQSRIILPHPRDWISLAKYIKDKQPTVAKIFLREQKRVIQLNELEKSLRSIGCKEFRVLDGNQIPEGINMRSFSKPFDTIVLDCQDREFDLIKEVLVSRDLLYAEGYGNLHIFADVAEQLIADPRPVREKKPKKAKKPKEPVSTPIEPQKPFVPQQAEISAVGPASGESRSKHPKPESVVKERPKFDAADRNKSYLSIHDDRCETYFQSCNIADPNSKGKEEAADSPDGVWQMTRPTLDLIKLKAQEICGSCYSEEVAINIFAQEYFRPEVASAYEKSKCLSAFSAFKNRNKTDAPKPLHEGKLITLHEKQPAAKRKTIKKIPVDLKAARDEALFLVGLQDWRRGLKHSEKIHDEIFDDCLRLGCIRFYNALVRHYRSSSYNPEANRIALDDTPLPHLRNVLVHNFPSMEELQTHYYDFVMPLEQVVTALCKPDANLRKPIVNLDVSPLAHLPVRNLTPENDEAESKTRIFDCLRRLLRYAKHLEDKEVLRPDQQFLKTVSGHYEEIPPPLLIWVHHARAIESCILQIGELSRGIKHISHKGLRDYIGLCRVLRPIGYHETVSENGQWNFDPLTPDVIASMIQGAKEFDFLNQ